MELLINSYIACLIPTPSAHDHVLGPGHGTTWMDTCLMSTLHLTKAKCHIYFGALNILCAGKAFSLNEYLLV